MTTHALNVDVDHFDEWITTLRTTDKPQAKGHLAVYVWQAKGSQVGYCCLGLGSTLVPNLPIDTIGEYEVEDDDSTSCRTFGEARVEDLAPFEFIRWLIPDAVDTTAEYDLTPDWPDGLRSQGRLIPALPAINRPERTAEPYDLRLITAAKMNDDDFTFEQIADVFAYFGIGSYTG